MRVVRGEVEERRYPGKGKESFKVPVLKEQMICSRNERKVVWQS